MSDLPFNQALIGQALGPAELRLAMLATRALDFKGVEFPGRPAISGLQFHWVEGGACQLLYGDGAIAHLEPSTLVITNRSLLHRINPVNGRQLPWVLSGQWATSHWLEHLLLDAQQPVVLRLSELPLPSEVQTVRGHVRDNQYPTVQTPVQPCLADAANAMLGVGLESLARPGNLNPLGRMLNHPRLGAWLSEVLQSNATLPLIDQAAAQCHYSRSAFTLNFTALTGMSYQDFLAQWRMNLSLLRFVYSKNDVSSESVRYGYASEAAYRKAFTRVMGITPGRAREADTVDDAMSPNPITDPLGARPATTEKPAERPARKPKASFQETVPPTVSVTQFNEPPSLSALLGTIISRL